MNKKSQATIFMIVGLIILIGGGIFYYSTQKIQRPYEPEIKIIQEQVPTEFNPIKSYATDCAYSAGVEGLQIIGKQGGYITFSNRSLNREPFTITLNPTESDAVAFTRDTDLRIPYWWYLKSANNCKGNCQFASKRPDLRQSDNSIEKQLERYIDFRFKECLNNFQPFVDQGFKVTEEGKVKTDVTIASDDVLVVVEYPLSVERQGSTSDLTQFLVRIPINLERVYELATKITDLQVKHNYLERHILNLIVSFSGVDKDKLPPMSDMQFKFGSSISWKKSDIKNKVTGLLLSYISLLQVDGTYNYDRNIFGSELKQRLYDSSILPVANSSFRDLSAQFTYLDFWSTYFDLNCNGERCVPSSANSIIPFIPFGIQTYQFAYDLSFPVFVEVQDPFALNGQGYTFNFFLEGNIRNNEHMAGDFTQLDLISFSERSQLCDIRTSSDVTVKVSDLVSKNPIDDAQVLYTLIDESCFIGSTLADGTLKEKFPIGVGGVVNLIKDNYIGKAVEFDAKIDSELSLDAEITPIFTKKVIIKKKNVVKTLQGWQFVDAPLDLSSKEHAIVTLLRISDGTELDFSSVAQYQGQQQPSEIEIAPGTYAADITLMLNERIVIPESEKCYRDPKKLFLGKKCFTIPEIDFGERSTPGQEQFSEGGLKLNLTFDANDLQNNDVIVLYVVSYDIAGVPQEQRVVEDLDQLGKVEEYSTTHKNVLQPTYE
ncbi:hypothetical protein CMO83_03560 [Candidatus Woesearchaeota archaeon]|jgi:hypothetical protein|nr:hypothetical protein [Candidatus Woesearchaeota archaeon]|tara:strand:- start:650 stop:2791 length:2142 start_codon:yes stop_codon:yes gene_type:complete